MCDVFIHLPFIGVTLCWGALPQLPMYFRLVCRGCVAGCGCVIIHVSVFCRNVFQYVYTCWYASVYASVHCEHWCAQRVPAYICEAHGGASVSLSPPVAPFWNACVGTII